MSDNKNKKSSASKKGSAKGQSKSEADLGSAASAAREQIQEQVMDLTEQVRQQVRHQVGEQFGEQFVTQKDRLAATLDTVALLLHQAGEHADLQDKADLAGYVDKASDRVSQWSVSLRDRDASQFIDDTVNYARRQPMVFLSGALVAGFAGARFLRSSAQKV